MDEVKNVTMIDPRNRNKIDRSTLPRGTWKAVIESNDVRRAKQGGHDVISVVFLFVGNGVNGLDRRRITKYFSNASVPNPGQELTGLDFFLEFLEDIEAPINLSETFILAENDSRILGLKCLVKLYHDIFNGEPSAKPGRVYADHDESKDSDLPVQDEISHDPETGEVLSI